MTAQFKRRTYFASRVTNAITGDVQPQELTGWVFDCFGIDNRPDMGFVVTHKPSGLRVALLERKSLKATKAAVAIAAELYDWNHDSLDAIIAAAGITPMALVGSLQAIEA